jgi:hypothetical protein
MDDKATSINNQASQSVASYDSRTLALLELLSEKSQDLADMLRGAWVTLNSSDNPDVLPQVAHSMRELVEKAPYRIPEVPVQRDDPGTRKTQIIALIRAYNNSNGQQTPAQLLTAQLEILWTLREYFVSVAHHGKPEATVDEVRQAIVQFEECLLNLMSPEPIPDLDELDKLIAQGEAL